MLLLSMTIAIPHIGKWHVSTMGNVLDIVLHQIGSKKLKKSFSFPQRASFLQRQLNPVATMMLRQPLHDMHLLRANRGCTSACPVPLPSRCGQPNQCPYPCRRGSVCTEIPARARHAGTSPHTTARLQKSLHEPLETVALVAFGKGNGVILGKNVLKGHGAFSLKKDGVSV